MRVHVSEQRSWARFDAIRALCRELPRHPITNRLPPWGKIFSLEMHLKGKLSQTFNSLIEWATHPSIAHITHMCATRVSGGKKQKFLCEVWVDPVGILMCKVDVDGLWELESLYDELQERHHITVDFRGEYAN